MACYPRYEIITWYVTPVADGFGKEHEDCTAVYRVTVPLADCPRLLLSVELLFLENYLC